MLCNPLLNERPKLLSLLHELLRLGLCHHLGVVIVENVALAPARIKVARQGRDTCSKRKLHGFKRSLVVSGPHDAVARTGNGHLGKLEYGVVSRGKLAVGREAHNPRVLEVARNNGTQVLKFSAACSVWLHSAIVE
jgi:hypothetical protein